MLKIKPPATEPFWLDLLPGVRVQVRPLTIAAMIAARQRASEALRAAASRVAAGGGGPEPGSAAGAKEAAAGSAGEPVATSNVDPEAQDPVTVVQVAIVRAVARSGILAWEGVGDAEGGPIDPTPAAIDDFVSIWPVFEALDRLYLAPAMAMEQEKNGSGPSRNGTSEEGQPTAAAATTTAASNASLAPT